MLEWFRMVARFRTNHIRPAQLTGEEGLLGEKVGREKNKGAKLGLGSAVSSGHDIIKRTVCTGVLAGECWQCIAVAMVADTWVPIA